jgi:hypothetical protein
VTSVKTNVSTSMTYTARLRAVASSELMRTPATSGLVVVHTAAAHAAPVYVAIKGTTVSAIAAARKASNLLPISDVVVFDGLAGIRTWDPPV